MGNRGILHDESGRVSRNHAHQAWITCALDFKGREQVLMAPGRYTQLFFLDEATAFAAGHRPCAECRRERYRSFVEAWLGVHGHPVASRPIPQIIDRALHSARITRAGAKITFQALFGDLPDGSIVEESGQPVLAWSGRAFRWTFDGYRHIALSPKSQVTVLTPKPIVDVFATGWRPVADV